MTIALLCLALYLVCGLITLLVLMQQRTAPDWLVVGIVVLAWPVILVAEVLECRRNGCSSEDW